MIYGDQVRTKRDIRTGEPNDVIGQVSRAPAGNLILRVGRTHPGSEGWEGGVAHIALTPDEARAFVDEIVTVMGWPA